MTDFYERLIMMLRNEQNAGDLSRDECSVLVELLKKSMLRVFGKDAKLGKEVEKMTEPLLELEIDKYIVMLRNAETDLSRAEAERDEMEANLSRAEAERNEVVAERDEVVAERDELQRQLAAMQAQIDALTAKQKG